MKGLPFVLFFTAMTFVAWGAYGPVLHHGSLALEHDSLRAFVGVGLAYFLIAVIIPVIILQRATEPGKWTILGAIYSLVAGAVGAVGALGIILALAYGGQTVYVMPLVFGFAPVVNTLVTAMLSRTFNQIRPVFVFGIITAALGAGGVLAFKPTPKPAAKPADSHSENVELDKASHAHDAAAKPPVVTELPPTTTKPVEAKPAETKPVKESASEPEPTAEEAPIEESMENPPGETQAEMPTAASEKSDTAPEDESTSKQAVPQDTGAANVDAETTIPAPATEITVPTVPVTESPTTPGEAEELSEADDEAPPRPEPRTAADTINSGAEAAADISSVEETNAAPSVEPTTLMPSTESAESAGSEQSNPAASEAPDSLTEASITNVPQPESSANSTNAEISEVDDEAPPRPEPRTPPADASEAEGGINNEESTTAETNAVPSTGSNTVPLTESPATSSDTEEHQIDDEAPPRPEPHQPSAADSASGTSMDHAATSNFTRLAVAPSRVSRGHLIMLDSTSKTKAEEGTEKAAEKTTAARKINILGIIGSIIMAALCWGSYGPMLHIGQSKMSGSRLRPFICVGLAYFFIAVAAPLFLIYSRTDDTGAWTASGMTWSILAGCAGAIGALGVILAFNAGGKPYYVMPLVFGFAPVINTFISLTESGTWGQVSLEFWISLGVVIAGAVIVLTNAPKPKPHAAPAK